MNDKDEQGRERDLKERILRAMRRNEQAPKKQLSVEEKQNLKTAASRLDQILKAAAQADVQSLKNAAARLDQMLENLRQGKELTKQLRRR